VQCLAHSTVLREQCVTGSERGAGRCDSVEVAFTTDGVREKVESMNIGDVD